MIRDAVRQGHIVIACGGGGIPVKRQADGQFAGLEAVIDKDLTSAVLATDVGAALLVILTAVPQVCVNFGRADERPLGAVTLEEIEKLQARGPLPAGQHGPQDRGRRALPARGRAARADHEPGEPAAGDRRARGDALRGGDMTPLRWGILGTARINRMLIPPLRVSPGNRLVAVASRDLARGEAYAREWEIGRVHGSYEALLADPEIDVVYIPLPNHLHAEWTIKAARAGKHVLCEKPLALTVEDVDAMAAACREAGVVLAEAFMYRHHPQTLKVKELLDSGAIGTLRFLRGSFSFPLTRPNDVRLRPEWGGGCLWDVGCYPLSFARFLVGREPLEVYGSQVSARPGSTRPSPGSSCFRATCCSSSTPASARRCARRWSSRGARVRSACATPGGRSRTTRCCVTRDGRAEAISVPGEDRFLLEIEDLAEAVRTGRPPRVSLADSRANVAALVALQRSAREGRPVRL